MERIKHSGWKIVARDEQRGPVKARELGLLGTGWEGVYMYPLGFNVSSSCSIDPQVPVQIHLGGIPV